MSRRQRARIERLRPGDMIPGPHPVPPGGASLGLIRRGDQAGDLVWLSSGRYVMLLSDGTMAVLDQHKVQSLLGTEVKA